MSFYRYEPNRKLQHLVECFWMVMDSNTVSTEQKIIPDGYPEIIFHFGDPYKIRLEDKWILQERSLLAGQMSKHFFLRNTGRSEIFGIKMKPAALTYLFGISMEVATDSVLDLAFSVDALRPWHQTLASLEPGNRVDWVQNELEQLPLVVPQEPAIDKAIDAIIVSHGLISIKELCDKSNVHERQLERLFKKFVGLSPKFYARIIRFSQIFQKVSDRRQSWAELGLASGYYDQSHFIKNFKAFTGEDPGKYFFDESTLANFFLRK
jgi:AraC-like DNA-binding protein